MKTKNIIGTDASLEICKGEGYMMMDTLGDKKLDVDKHYPVFNYWPDTHTLDVNTTYSWKDAQEKYMRHKEGIDKFADDMPARMLTKEPSFNDLLQAVDTLSHYCGLD